MNYLPQTIKKHLLEEQRRERLKLLLYNMAIITLCIVCGIIGYLVGLYRA